jgi:3-oxoacyl-[acyl-carrier-protein] synthase-1
VLTLDILELGLVSPVGRDLVTSCAAARAGIQRVFETPVRVVGVDNRDMLALGQRLACLTTGFRHDARLLRLLVAALSDLKARLGPRLSPARVAVHIAIPAAFHDALDVVIDPDSTPWEHAPTRPEDAERGAWLVHEALRSAELPWSPSQVTTVTAGQASVGMALHRAAASATREHDLTLVLAADAPVDLHRVEALASRGRLKTPQTPTGMFPGEVGAAMLVAGPALSRRHSEGERPRGRVIEPCSNHGDIPSIELCAKVLNAASAGAQRRTWCIVDLNGEEARALRWGMLCARLQELEPVELADLWVPALCFGDAGAATGLAAIAMAVRGFERGYAPGDMALVICGSDGGTHESVFGLARADAV